MDINDKKYTKTECIICNGSGLIGGFKCTDCNGTGYCFTDEDENIKKPTLLFTITTVGKLREAILKYEAMSNKDLQELPEKMVKDGTAELLGSSDKLDADLLTGNLREEGFKVKDVAEDLRRNKKIDKQTDTNIE